MNINEESLIKEPNILYHIANQEGFEFLTITTGVHEGAWYYGFSYLHLETMRTKGIGTVGVACSVKNKPFATEHAAFIAAIKNIEQHFSKGFRLYGAYAKYQEITQLVLA
jgi:hypothetical protein